MKYWMIDPLTKEVIGEYDAQSKWNIPRNAITTQPLPTKQGFAVVVIHDKSGMAVDSEYIEDHRTTTVYDKTDCTKSESVSELGSIKDNFTPKKPVTQFDEWIDDAWVTNKSNQHIAEYNQIDNVRRSQYVQVCDPLFAEANIKRLQGFEGDARAIEAQALAARDKIQTENPWPTPPTN
ncbi:hypothetical protein [Vibrio bathopelagicus]|uniref:hypothetical protein n=1 Tax=Vibrio bathopelagicus TaxID=2777577 RepID=UPI00186434BB|nr:hypothetical protein [Vibrio bathopelagicus]